MKWTVISKYATGRFSDEAPARKTVFDWVLTGPVYFVDHRRKHVWLVTRPKKDFQWQRLFTFT